MERFSFVDSSISRLLNSADTRKLRVSVLGIRGELDHCLYGVPRRRAPNFQNEASDDMIRAFGGESYASHHNDV